MGDQSKQRKCKPCLLSVGGGGKKRKNKKHPRCIKVKLSEVGVTQIQNESLGFPPGCSLGVGGGGGG